MQRHSRRKAFASAEDEQHQLDRIERELNGADLRFPSSQKTNTAGRRLTPGWRCLGREDGRCVG